MKNEFSWEIRFEPGKGDKTLLDWASDMTFLGTLPKELMYSIRKGNKNDRFQSIFYIDYRL